jgi:TusA-related sulfurtransferase
MSVREVGASFLDALLARDYTAARALLVEDVRFRMLVPDELMTEADADGTIGRFTEWYAAADRFEVEASTLTEIEGRVAVVYHFRLHNTDGWQAIEQHLMLDVNDEGRIEAIDLLCSGFRSIAAHDSTGLHQFDAGEMGCADGLAGEFRRQMQEIPVGEVLVVIARDPAAKEDLPPLARLMGHVVRSVEAPGDGRLLVAVERGR